MLHPSNTLSRRHFCMLATGCLLSAALPFDALAAGKKVLVTYFSATGYTKAVAEKLAHALHADLKRIVPALPYTDADLNWNDKQSRSSVEMKDPKARPAMAAPIDASGYDVIFVGYPIWWGLAPRIVNTFLESTSLDGKTVVPFCTSGGSGLGQSGTKLKESAPKAVWRPGREFHSGDAESSIGKWGSAMAGSK